MNASELREALDTLGLSQRDAAHALEVAPRLFRYWLANDPRYPIPAIADYAVKWLLHINRN